MPRTELDLRDKTMAELEKVDRENGNLLSGLDCSKPEDAEWIANLLADRRQIRQRMKEMLIKSGRKIGKSEYNHRLIMDYINRNG